MTSKIKVNILADGGDNSIITSDGAGSFTASSSLASSVQSVGGIQNTPAFAVKEVAGQSIPNNSSTKATFDTIEFDTDSVFDLSNNRFIVPSGEDGKYYIQGWGNIPGLDAGEIGQVFFQKNGITISNTIVRNYLQGTNQLFRMITSTLVELSATDYVEFWYYQNSGESQTVVNTYFSGFKLIGA